MSLSATPDPTHEKACCKLTGDFEILRQLPVFSGASSEVIKLFAYLAKRRVYQAGEYIIETGKEADRSFLLISGEAEVTTTHNGQEVVLQKLKPDAFFGELALLARFNWYFNVRVSQEADVIIIDRQSFKKVLSRYPDRRDKIIEKIVQLRVSRQIQQTSFILEKLLNSDRSDSPSPTLSI